MSKYFPGYLDWARMATYFESLNFYFIHPRFSYIYRLKDSIPKNREEFSSLPGWFSRNQFTDRLPEAFGYLNPGYCADFNG